MIEMILVQSEFINSSWSWFFFYLLITFNSNNSVEKDFPVLFSNRKTLSLYMNTIMIKSGYIFQCNNITTMYPAKLVLWQHSFYTAQRNFDHILILCSH